MERETVKLKLDISGADIILVSALTGGEVMDIEAAPLGQETQTTHKGVTINGAMAYKLRLKKLIEMIVVSINGVTDKAAVWQAVKDLPGPDYMQLIRMVNDINSGLPLETQKKNSAEIL